jgi:transitional endoplasmic reticulum ATPase
VAALLAIARRSDPEAAPGDRSVDGDWVAVSDDDDDDLDKVALWVELKKQIGILREGMDKKS